MNAFQLASGNLEVARLFGAAGQQDGVIVPGEGFHRHIHAHVRVGHERDALGAHLLNAAVDDVLFHLEVGNAVTQQAADAVCLFVNSDGVTGAAQLLRCCQSGWPAAHHSHALAGVLLRRFGMNPSLLPGALDDTALDELNRDGGLIDAQHAGRLAGRGADAAGEFGKVVGGVKPTDSRLPAAVVNQIVPVGNEVINRAAGVTEGHPAVHAAGSLLALLLLGDWLVDLEPVVKAVLDLAAGGLFALNLQKSCHLTHATPLP